jgi:hypothetical protein
MLLLHAEIYRDRTTVRRKEAVYEFSMHRREVRWLGLFSTSTSVPQRAIAPIIDVLELVGAINAATDGWRRRMTLWES